MNDNAERRYKVVMVNHAALLDLFMEPRMTEFHFNHCVFEGCEGATVVDIHYDIPYRAFSFLLTREDWDVVPAGACIPRIEGQVVVVGVKLDSA